MTSTNDGKDVKSNQTSGPKGKSYYIELYKSLEARLTEGSDARERSKLLCVAWRSVHSLCQHSAPSTHTHLINWIQRHTARAVLQTEWQKPEREDDRNGLEEAIDTFIGQVAETPRDGGPLPWEAHLVARGEWFKRVLDKPWDHPVLTLLLNPNGTPPTDDEVLEWLKEERGVTFVMRLHTLAGEKCDDIAVSLASAVMDRARAGLPPVADSEEQTEAPPDENAPPTFADKLKEEAGFTPDVWEALMDIEFVLLHKRDSKRCIALAKQTPLLDAYPLIERLQKRLEVSPREKRLWKNAKEVAILIAQVVIARCMVVKNCMNAARVALYCCARLLARLLTTRLPGAADALAAQAPTARHLHTLAQAVDKQLSPTNEEMKPYVCELYVRAITAGMNELERLKLKTEKEADARSMEKTLASWFVQLGTVLARSDRIACECTLTAFSLHPSQKMFERINAAPPLAPVITDANDSKEETVKSEFGSWASDSRSQTNLVKTSETLNMKHTQNQANVLSTAIFNEGEALGLSPELCQDIAVLLAGPRVKTLSWDMDRTLLLENCRAYCEVTHEGTRVLTRELKYLNLDLQQYQHLPEEKDDDENDPYYGIERGYEHLAVLDEPQEIWEDADKTETASSMEEDYNLLRRKKKTKQSPLTSDEDSDLLSHVAETKRTQKKKERPHSKERKEKKKQDLVDPLDINVPSQSETLQRYKKEPKEKKERKKKEKVPKVIGGKRSALAGLLGLKTGKAKKVPKHVTTAATPGTSFDSQGIDSLAWLTSKAHDKDAIAGAISGTERKNNPKTHLEVTKNVRNMYNIMGSKSSSSQAFERSTSTLTRMQYKPQTSNAPRQHTPMNTNKSMTNMNINPPDTVRANLSKLLEFRRETKTQQRLALHNNLPYSPPRQPAIINPNVPLNTNISPKSVTIPEIPKSYINKEQTEKMVELLRIQNTIGPKDSVIQYAQKQYNDKKTTVPRKAAANKTAASSSRESWAKAQHSNMMKITDFVNPYDRHLAEIIARQSRGHETIKPPHSQYPVVKSQRPVQRSYNVVMPGQRDFENFLKEYDNNKLKSLIPDAVDMSSKSPREVKKPIMPTSKVTPVIPYLPKTETKAPSSPYIPKLENSCQSSPYMQTTENKCQSPKQVVKKPDLSLNTFSRLSYHKNKQNEMKNKNQSPKPVCTTTTYQEVSSELDEIIKEHQRAQMKVIQAKRDSADKLMKTANVRGPAVKSDETKHPLLSNMLQNSTSHYNTSCRNDAHLKCNFMQQTSPAAQKSFLSEKDNNDVLKLLQQQERLNNPLHHYSTSVTTKPSTPVSKPPCGSNNKTNSSQSQTSMLPSQGAKSLLETKIINIISNTLLKPGLHEINKSISINTDSSDSARTKPIDFTKTTVKKNATSKNEIENKHIPESMKPEWQAVMSDLLRHKTPTRGPNALDMALNKSSFETAFEKSVKEPETLSQSQSLTEKDVLPAKHQEKADHQKPLITSIQNVIITKKGIKLKNEVPKSQKDTSADLKTYLKQSLIATNEKSKVHNTSETTKKLSQEVQRKHFTYSGPKNIDPFISGIPNSDYDLLEELMDDDLRKEIGELSSDDESYDTVAQSFLKPSNSSEKRVSVQFNKDVNEPATKPATNVRCLNDHKSTSDILLSVTPKPSQCTSKMSQVPIESNSLEVKQSTEKEILDGNCLIQSTSQNVPVSIYSPSNSENQAYNRTKSLTTNQVMVESKTYISAVPQLAPLQNVVLLGQEVIYGGYANIQTSVQNVHSLTPNTYVSVNSAPTMTLYQTTHYATPVVIGTSITVPVMNNVSCSGTSAPPNVNNVVVQPCYPAVTVEQNPSEEDIQISVLTTDTRNEECSADYFQSNLKLQEETKASERKVLCEVQDFAASENINNTRNKRNDNTIKKDTVTNTERLKNKRLAIINRKINHRCLDKTIPLTYSPLPAKIKAVLEKQDFSKAIPVSDKSSSHKEHMKKLFGAEEEKFLAQIKNNLQDLSNAINEVPSPATPDSNDSKENKSYTVVPCRRILLRSSNKITIKPNDGRNISEAPALKKIKAKLKSEVSDVVAVASEKAKKGNTDEKEVQKRASKRLHSKKTKLSTDDNKGKKPLRQKLQKPNPKAKSSSTDTVISKLLKTTESESDKYQDIESELPGTKIEKIAFGNNNESNKDNEKSGDCEEDTVVLVNRKNVEVPEVSISQTLKLEQSSEESVVSAPKTNEDIRPKIAIPQNTELLGHSYQSSVEHIYENNKNVNMDKKCVSDHGGDNENDRNAITINSANERARDKAFNDTSKNTDDNSQSFVKKADVNDICVSRLPCDGLKEDDVSNTIHNDISKLTSNSVDSKEILPVPVLNTDLIVTNGDVKVADQKCDVPDNMSHDLNKNELLDKDNIDLDMSVTCEEVPKQKLRPTFGTIKTARNKPINANKSNDLPMSVISEVPKLSPKYDTNRRARSKPIKSNENKGEYVKDCDDVIVNNISVSKNKFEKATDSNDFEISQNIESFIECVNIQPTPKTPLEIKPSKTGPKPPLSSVPHFEQPPTTNNTIDIDDDVVIIDDDIKAKSVICGEPQSEVSTENYVSKNAPVVNFMTNSFDDKTREQHAKEVSPSNVLSSSNVNRTQTVKNTSEELLNSTQNFKDNIRIEHLPPKDPTTKRVRVCLPNGRRIIVTAGSEVCITLDSLLSFPSIKQALLTEMDCKKRYIMYLQQTATVDNRDRNKILSVQLNKIENLAPTVLPHRPVETVNLLSDDEENDTPQTIDVIKQVFVTECGKFTAPPMDKELFIKHQNKFSQKSQILLKKVDEKSSSLHIDTMNATLLSTNHCPKEGIYEVQNKIASENNTLSVIPEKAKPGSRKENTQNDKTPFVPTQYLVGLLTEIENKFTSEICSKPLIIPEIVEIDDSSNDSLHHSKSTEAETKGKTIYALKNELLKELGVESQGSVTYDDVELVEESTPPKTNKRRKVHKLSVIPAGKSCSFNDLDEKVQLQVTKRKCAIKLVRCDELVKTYKKDLADAINQPVQALDDELFMMTENCIFNNLEEKMLETEERSRSPVIELSDVLVSFNNKILEEDTLAISYITPSCKANWHNTKSMFHTESIDSAASVRCYDACVINQIISQSCTAKSKIIHLQGTDDTSLLRPYAAKYAQTIPHATDQVIPVSCEAIWRATKHTLHTQSVDDDAEMYGDNSTNKVIPIACKSYWLFTKNVLHLQSVDSVPEYDYEMCDDAFHGQTIPLSCEANWLTTKSTLRVQRANDVASESCCILEDDYEMCNNDLINKKLPLFCDANWFMTKPMLQHLQKINDVALIHCNVFEKDKVSDDCLVHEEVPPSCDANWLTTKTALHCQAVNTLTPLNVLDFETEINCIHVQNVPPVTCEARWFTTKTSLHLEAARNIVLLPSNVVTKDSCDKGSTLSVLNVTSKIPFQTALPPSAPSLVSLVLACFRNTSLIQQHTLLHNASPRSYINLLKRKSPSHRSSAVCKVSKLNKTTETKFSNPLSQYAINTSLDLENVSQHIIQETKLTLHLEKSSVNKILNSFSNAKQCDDNHGINMCVKVEHLPQGDVCEIKDRVVLNSNITSSVSANYTLSELSDVFKKDCEENVASLDKCQSSETIFLASDASLKKKSVEATAVDRNTNIEIICKSSETSELPDVLKIHGDESLSEERATSPVIDIANFFSTLPLYNSSDHANQLLSSNITAEQALHKNTESYSSNSNSERSLEANNIQGKLEQLNDFDHKHIEAKKSAKGNLGEKSLDNELYAIEKSNCDDIEAKLAEIVGESLSEAKTTNNSQWDGKNKMPDSEKFQMIELLLGDEPFINTNKRNTVTTGARKEKIHSAENSDTLKNLKTGEHNYYFSLDEPLCSFDKDSKNKNERNYEDVMTLSENESNLELEQEIVEMRNDEIVGEVFFDTTTVVIPGENSQSKICDNQVSGSVNLEKNMTTENENVIGQVTLIRDDCIALRKDKENKFEEAEDSIENCNSAPIDTIILEGNTTELLNDVSTESIMHKYRALVRNKSQVLESIVEYEDPDSGIYYIIPIVEESQSHIKPNENEKVTPMQSPNIKEKKVNPIQFANIDSNCQSSISHVRADIKDNSSNYDDIEARLAEIVGESLAGKERTGNHKTCFLEKYSTYNPEKSVEGFTCRLRKPDDQKALFNPSKGRTNSGASKKRSSKYHDKSEDVNNVMVTKKIKLMKHTSSNYAKQRKIDTLPSKINERKYRKNDNATAGNSKIISKNECCFDEKYKFSYNLEVEAIPRLEMNSEDVIWNMGESIKQDSSKTEQSSGVRNISEAIKEWPSSSNDTFEHSSYAGKKEKFELKLPKFTYSKASEQVRERQKNLKRKTDASDAKTSERKYRKGKNIDYPKFTAATLSESAYTKEFKSLMAYCDSVKFSFAVAFHKEHIDVHEKLKSWPLENYQPEAVKESVESYGSLFTEIEKSEALADPLELTLSAEINTKFDENSYTPSNINETNFNMGFGERSGRVIQELDGDGEFTTFSAATLSDVKQLQPLLPSDEKVKLAETKCFDNNGHDQKLKVKRFVDHLKLRDKVRSFFEKTKSDLTSGFNLNSKKDDFENNYDNSSWPFGDLTSTKCMSSCLVEMTVNVVQVGQLPVSAAAQNPVTCDPRVTHVSNASPSQCSPGNNLGDELQTPIKTEYTELTTADITLPLMQEYVQNHSSSDSQQPTNLYSSNDNTSMTTQIKSIVKIELMEETSQENEEDNLNYDDNCLQQVNGSLSNTVQYHFENSHRKVSKDDDPIVAESLKTSKTTTFLDDKQTNDAVEKPDQLAHAMNAAGISATKGIVKSKKLIDPSPQHDQPNLVTASQATTTNNFSKGTPINALSLQQALAQILPSPLNQSNTSENSLQSSTNPQVLHIVQGNNAQSVINKPNGTQLLHIVQNKTVSNTNGPPASQQNTFSGLSLVDGAIQQGANQLLHIVNTTNQNNNNAGQLLKRVNLLTNLANVQGPNEQKMVQFVCKSTDGKSIQLPHQRSMVLRLQPMEPPNVPTTPKQNDSHDHSSSYGTIHSVNEKESNQQEMKSRSLYEENYAKFVQNDPKFAHNGDSKGGLEKATSLPKFNQVFGKQIYQDKQNEIDGENLPENSDPPEENNPNEQSLDHINDLTNPPVLIRKNNPTQPSQVKPNLVQQIKQTIGPMNIQTMHGGVIYTRQIPVNIGNGQTINLITVPSTELVDDSAQKQQQTDRKFGNQEGDPPIIKIVPTNQHATTPNGSTDENNAPMRPNNETNSQPNTQPQPVLTQMRIKLPMLSKAPQMVGGTRVVRPSFFQIQRNVIGGANQQVYQQLVLTTAPPLGQSIRLPAQVQKPKTPSEAQSSPESQMSSSTLEQLREFDMVLEQVKERSTVQPGSASVNTFTKLKSTPDTTDTPNSSASTQESPTQVLYSVGNTQPLNMVNFVNRKSAITSTSTSSFVRSPDSTGTVESPSSSTQSHLPHTITSDSCASSSCASEAAAATAVQPKPKKKKPKPSTSTSNPFNIKNTPKPSSQKPLEDEQTTQRILYILAEYKEQVENSPDKDKPAPRRRNNPAAPNAGSSKRKKSSSGSRRREMSPVLGEDSCRTMGSEDSSCGTSLGECNECLDTHSPEESPKKVVRQLTFEQETQATQTRTSTTTPPTTNVPQRNVIVTDGQAFSVRGPAGKPATTVLMPANYLLPVSMVKGGQQIAIVTNRGPKLLVGAGEGATGGTLLFQRLIGPGGLKPVLARPGVRHIRLPTAALHNLQAFNIAAPAPASVQPPDSTASPAPAPTPPDLVDTRAMSSPWPDRDTGEVKPERGNSSPEGSEPWNLPSSSIADDYGYEEIVRTDNMDRTVLDAIPDRYSPDLEAQRIFDKMFDSDSKKSMYDSRCGYDIDASDDDKAYHQVVHRKDGRHTTRLTHVSAAALRHKYAILEHELRLQKSLSEECEDLGVDSPSASELFPEAELLFAPSPAHEQTIDHCHTPQPTVHAQGISQPEVEDQIATDHLLAHKERRDELDLNLDDVGEIVTVGEDGVTTIPLDQEEFARSHPNTTFHSEPEDGEVPPFTIAQGVKGRQITFHSRAVPGTVVMAPQTTVISQATVEASGTQNPVKFSDINNMISVIPSAQPQINMPSVLKESNESLTKFDRLLNESRELDLSNTASAIVHSTGNGTQVIRRVQYEGRDSRYLVDDDAMIAGDSKTEDRRDLIDDTSSSERHPELFWDTQSRTERKRFDFSSDSDKCCRSPYEEINSDSSGIGAHTRLDSVIKAARTERGPSDGSSAEESHPPLRTYPPKRTHQHTHHSHHDTDRSVTGKTRASDRCHDVKDESRRRASNRGVVKRGCHCCNGSAPPKPKKSRPKKNNDYPHN